MTNEPQQIKLDDIESELAKLMEEQQALAKKEQDLITKRKSLLDALANSIGHRIIEELNILSIDSFNSWFESTKHKEKNEPIRIPLPVETKQQPTDYKQKLRKEIEAKKETVYRWIEEHETTQDQLSVDIKKGRSFIGQALSNSKANEKNPKKQSKNLDLIIASMEEIDERKRDKQQNNAKIHIESQTNHIDNTQVHNIDYAQLIADWLDKNNATTNRTNLAKALNIPVSQLNDVINKKLQMKAKSIYKQINKLFNAKNSLIDHVERDIKLNPNNKIIISIIPPDDPETILYYKGPGTDPTNESYLALEYTEHQYDAKLLDINSTRTFYTNFIIENPDVLIDLTIVPDNDLKQYSQSYNQ